MDHVATRIDGGQDGLAVDEDLDCGLFGTVEAEVNLVETWCDGQNHGLVFIPQEVLRTSVDGLYLPWNRETVLQFTTLPKPPCRAVLCAQGLVDGILFLKRLIKLGFSYDSLVQIFVYFI